MPECHKAEDAGLACAALITDLQHRGLLNETLIVWASEFGSKPLAQCSDIN